LLLGGRIQKTSWSSDPFVEPKGSDWWICNSGAVSLPKYRIQF